MSSTQDGPTRWYSLPEVAEALGVPLREVRTMVREQRLAGMRRGVNNAYAVPAEFLVQDEGRAHPLPSLRGTLIQLSDAGCSEDEAVRWLFRHEPSLDTTPVAALRDKRTHAVRRAAQTLAF